MVHKSNACSLLSNDSYNFYLTWDYGKVPLFPCGAYAKTYNHLTYAHPEESISQMYTTALDFPSAFLCLTELSLLSTEVMALLCRIKGGTLLLDRIWLNQTKSSDRAALVRYDVIDILDDLLYILSVMQLKSQDTGSTQMSIPARISTNIGRCLTICLLLYCMDCWYPRGPKGVFTCGKIWAELLPLLRAIVYEELRAHSATLSASWDCSVCKVLVWCSMVALDGLGEEIVPKRSDVELLTTLLGCWPGKNDWHKAEAILRGVLWCGPRGFAWRKCWNRLSKRPLSAIV